MMKFNDLKKEFEAQSTTCMLYDWHNDYKARDGRIHAKISFDLRSVQNGSCYIPWQNDWGTDVSSFTQQLIHIANAFHATTISIYDTKMCGGDHIVCEKPMLFVLGK
jgi:hypothetical protein